MERRKSVGGRGRVVSIGIWEYQGVFCCEITRSAARDHPGETVLLHEIRPTLALSSLSPKLEIQ